MGFLGSRLGITRYEADEYYRMALELYKKKNLEEAMHHIDSAIQLYPKRAEYHATRGFLRLEDGLPDHAEPDFDAALRLHAYEMLANYGKGVITYGRKQYEEAREYFMRAWAIDPQRPEILYYLALTEHRLKNNQKALHWMQQAAAIYEPLSAADRDARRHFSDAGKWIKVFEKLSST